MDPLLWLEGTVKFAFSPITKLIEKGVNLMGIYDKDIVNSENPPLLKIFEAIKELTKFAYFGDPDDSTDDSIYRQTTI